MAGTGVTGSLGTLTRPDGTTQVSFGGHPLYYWQGDTKAGEVTGNGIDGFTVATVGAAAPQPPASAAPRPHASAAAPAPSAPARYNY